MGEGRKGGKTLSTSLLYFVILPIVRGKEEREGERGAKKKREGKGSGHVR